MFAILESAVAYSNDRRSHQRLDRAPSPRRTGRAGRLDGATELKRVGRPDRALSPGGAGMILLEEIDAKIDAGDLTSFRMTRPRE